MNAPTIQQKLPIIPMAVFAYKALDTNSSPIQGTISADNPRTARDLLRSRGLVVETVAAQQEAIRRSWWPFRRRNRHSAKRVAMIRELSTLLSAGIPLLEALDSQAKQHSGNFQTSLLLLRDRVAAGSMLADGMREQPDVYDALSVHMVEVGENSGTLDKVLDQLANFSGGKLRCQGPILGNRQSVSCGSGLIWLGLDFSLIVSHRE